MGSLRKINGPLKVPRLRMKDELLKSAPELAKLLGEEVEDPEKEFNANRLDTPRGHEEQISEAEQLQNELAAVKKDRSEIIHSLAHIKTNLVGSGGGEAQTMQILQLEKELELKKLTLNDLRTEGKKLTKRIADTQTHIHDAILLTPGGYENEISTIKQLMSDMARLEEDLIEAEAKNRLYYLLGERTRNDHLEMERKVRVARELKNAAAEDHATLTQHMHDMRASKEEAERQLSHMRKMLEDAKKDWMKKMKDRKKEVQELKRRQEREELRELKRKERQEEDSKKEQERLRKIALEQEAHEMQIQELAPKIEAMEASWNRLRTITGADEPEEVIAYWEGLKSKEENMRQLVAASEAQEAAVKTKIEELLKRRNDLLEQDASAAASSSAVDNSEDYEVRISDAHRKVDTMRKKFEKLRTVCISAEQGLRSMLDRTKVALQEIAPGDLVPVSKIPQGTPPRPGKKMERRESSVFRKAVNSRDGKRGPSPKQPEGAPLDTEAADAAAGLQLPSGHTNTIDDEAFFENLPSLLADVNDRLGKLMDLEGESLQKLAKLDATGEVPPVDTEKAESEGRSKEDDDEEDPGAAEGDGAGAEAAQEGAAQAAANAGDDMGAVADANAAAEAAADGEALDADARSQSAADGGEGAGAARDSVASGAPGSDTAQDAQAASEALAGADAAAHAEADAQTATAVPDADAAPKMSAAARASIGDHEVAAGELPLTEADRVLQQRSSEAPVHERTVLDALFEDNSQDVEEEIERRMAKMNKGMKKLDWSGAPLMGSVNPDLKAVMPPLSTMTKKSKGRKRAADKAAPLERIMGYTEDNADEDDDGDDDEDGDDDGDGVVERDAIKRMAAKMEARAAKARAEAAHAGQA